MREEENWRGGEERGGGRRGGEGREGREEGKEGRRGEGGKGREERGGKSLCEVLLAMMEYIRVTHWQTAHLDSLISNGGFWMEYGTWQTPHWGNSWQPLIKTNRTKYDYGYVVAQTQFTGL